MPRTGDEKIALMHLEYGKMDGGRCRNCEHIEAHCNGDCTRVWYKCRMFGISSGPGTDWRAGNEACGAFRISPEDAKRRHLYGEVYRRVKGLRVKRAEKIEGQIEMAI